MTQKQFPTEIKTFTVLIDRLTDRELHDCMVEEASEVIKALCKAERFGPWSNVNTLCNHKDLAPYMCNARDVLTEFDQLCVLVDEYRERLNIEPGSVSASRLVMRETI